MMVFAEDVLVRVGLFCAFLVLLVFASFLVLASMKLVGLAIPGWFSIGSGLLVSILMEAAILTFVSLMITGSMRIATPPTREQLDLLIERTEKIPALVSRSKR